MTGLGGTHAWAFSLGRVTVLSVQGEPLRAEIDITELKDDEATSLKAGIAPAEMFRAAGLAYAPHLNQILIDLQKRPDGRAYLRLRGGQPITDGYLDLVLEMSWSTGRTVRDYTLLFEPPRPQPEPVATPAQITPPSPQAAASDSTVAAPDASPPPAAPASPAAAPKAAPAAKAASRSITVKAGDTAGKLAAANLPADVSLEQMLVALLRANPNAFINGNVNLVKAGATLTLPDAEQARAVGSPKEARRMVVAQSKDFNEYRRKLAGHAPKTAVSTPRREASGAVEARVEDKKASAPSADKLTLSKGIGKDGKATREDEISQRHNEKEAADRAAELAKNISELSKLSAEMAQPAASQASAGAGPALATAAPPAPVASAPASPASAPGSAASEPQAPASAASSPAAAPLATPTWLDALIDTPMLPLAALSLVALLTALGLYRARRRRQPEPLVSSPLVEEVGEEPSVEPAAPVAEAPRAAPAAPAMPPKDADPVAEADVYLAYGRDLQAEAVLREGLRTEPERMAIHQKLLDIYSRRLDLDNFEAKAREVFQLTGGAGEDWARVCALGQEIDPTNRLYGGDYTGDDEPAEEVGETSEGLVAQAEEPGEDDWPLDTETKTPEPSAATPAVPMELTLDLNLDLDTPADDAKPQAAEADAEPAFEPEQPPAAPAKVVEPPSPQAVEAGKIDIDMDALALDAEAPAAPTADDPLGVKLALAEEFNAIGDADGARALIEEVIAEATGDMKTKAQEALAKLR